MRRPAKHVDGRDDRELLAWRDYDAIVCPWIELCEEDVINTLQKPCWTDEQQRSEQPGGVGLTPTSSCAARTRATTKLVTPACDSFGLHRLAETAQVGGKCFRVEKRALTHGISVGRACMCHLHVPHSQRRGGEGRFRFPLSVPPVPSAISRFQQRTSSPSSRHQPRLCSACMPTNTNFFAGTMQDSSNYVCFSID